jgi:hypothetical protein
MNIGSVAIILSSHLASNHEAYQSWDNDVQRTARNRQQVCKIVVLVMFSMILTPMKCRVVCPWYMHGQVALLGIHFFHVGQTNFPHHEPTI